MGQKARAHDILSSSSRLLRADTGEKAQKAILVELSPTGC
jgi:hypothetical protein